MCAARLGRGPSLLSLLPHFPGPRPGTTQEPGGTELFPGAERWESAYLQKGQMWGGGQLLCASSSSHNHSHQPRQLFKELPTQARECTAPGQLSELGRRGWASNQQELVGTGVRTRSSTRIPGLIVSVPSPQAPGVRLHIRYPL